MRDQSVWIYQWLPSCSSRINNGSLTHCMLGVTMTTNRIVCPQFCELKSVLIHDKAISRVLGSSVDSTEKWLDDEV